MANGSSVMVNGHSGDQLEAGPSKTYHHLQPDVTGSRPALHESVSYETDLDAFQNAQLQHDASIVSHIYQSGFQQGNYADVQLIVLNRSYRLHCLILSRSPYLDHLIRSSHNKQIFVPLETFPHITEESFAIALGYLYASTSINLVSPTNARSVLATACLLGGMDELCAYAYELCKTSISMENIDDWLDFLQTLPSSPSVSESGAVSPAGVTMPNLPSVPPLHELQHVQFGVGPAPTNGVSSQSSSSTIFGPYGLRLRDDVFLFLVSTLPRQLATANPGNPGSALADVYVRLPFEYFKAAVESGDFPIGKENMQDRFRFAKSVVAARKRGVARDAEETVVLAFDGASESNSRVHVTRKMRGRRLWKVGGK